MLVFAKSSLAGGDPFQDVDFAGEVFELNLDSFEDTGGLTPMSDDDEQFDYFSRLEVLLEGLHGRSAGLNIRVHLIGKLQHEPLHRREAFRILPVLNRGDLFVSHADMLCRWNVLSPFVDRMAIFGGP